MPFLPRHTPLIKEPALPEPKLNAVVTLRDEISPWLMILRVVADGWELPEFLPGQFFMTSIPLDDVECGLDDFLAGSEAMTASVAHAATPDYLAAPGCPAVDHLVFVMAASRTTHGFPLTACWA